MKVEFTTTAYCKDGKLLIRNRNQVESDCVDSGVVEFDVIIRKKTKSRSVLQNRYYRGCVRIVADYLGYRPEKMHQIIGFKFLKRMDVDEDSGEAFEYIKSTAELTTVEFSEFMNEFIEWADEMFDIKLPIPNQQFEILPNQK